MPYGCFHSIAPSAPSVHTLILVIRSPRIQAHEQSVSIMLSTRQSTSRASNTELFISALANYTNITGTDLSKGPTLKMPSSPEAFLQLLQKREKAFNEYSDGNPRLISCLNPGVNVLWAFFGELDRAVDSDKVRDTSHLVSLNVTSSGPHSTSQCFDFCN